MILDRSYLSIIILLQYTRQHDEIVHTICNLLKLLVHLPI